MRLAQKSYLPRRPRLRITLVHSLRLQFENKCNELSMQSTGWRGYARLTVTPYEWCTTYLDALHFSHDSVCTIDSSVCSVCSRSFHSVPLRESLAFVGGHLREPTWRRNASLVADGGEQWR